MPKVTAKWTPFKAIVEVVKSKSMGGWAIYLNDTFVVQRRYKRVLMGDLEMIRRTLAAMGVHNPTINGAKTP